MILSFNPGRGLIIAPTRLVGPHGEIIVRMAIDTGATGSVLAPALLSAVGYEPNAPGEQTQIITSHGTETIPKVHVDKLEAAGIIRLAFRIGSYNLPAAAGIDGVLGADFFRGRRLTVDFHSGRVSVD